MPLVCIIIIALIAVFLALYALFQPYCISGVSMYDTLIDGDIYATLPVLSVKQLVPGDIYIYTPPQGGHKYVVKRLISLEKLVKDGKESAECYFIGDNREESFDSRDYGAVSNDKVRRKILFKLL